MADLPRAVHFVSNAPVLDVVGILVSVGNAKVGPVGSAWIVAVFNHVACILWCSCPHVYGSKNFSSRFFCPVNKFVNTNFIWFYCVPCAVKADRPFVLWSDSVLPVVAAQKVSARIANEGHIKVLYKIDDISPESLAVCRRVAWFIDSRVYCAAKMFDERTEQVAVHFSDSEFLYKSNLRFHMILQRKYMGTA